MSKRMRISAEVVVKEISNSVSQTDNEMDSDDSYREDLDDLNGDAGVYNNYCITFTSLVKRNLHTTFTIDT